MSELFIRRPVATTLVMLALLLFGAMAYRLLPVSDLPNVDFPTLLVTASLPGASPETMASAVATPLEKQFSTIAGLDSMTSASSLGSTQITLQFALSRSLDAAAQDVQAAISASLRQLPLNMPNPPTYQKVNPADQPIIYIGLTAPTLELSRLNEYAETLLAPRISTVSGVAQVQVFGAQKYAVRVQIDPQALASRGLGLDEVAAAVANANVNLPTGVLDGAHQSVTVDATGQLDRAPAYQPLIVAWRDGSPVRIQDIGRVIDSVENNRVAAWIRGERALVLAVQRQPGTNTVEVSRAVRELLPRMRDQLPASVKLQIINDRAEAIEHSVDDVKFTLVLTLVLVVLVIFVFLRSFWATLIPSLALPLSIVATFAAMYVLGYSLDNLSLMALTLSVGFVVDDAIVMLENIVRHQELGERPFEAAIRGAREIGFTIVSMTVSLAAVFIPVLFLGGILGRLFRAFSVTIALAILISGFVSLTLTPMMASRVLRPAREQRHGRLYRASERAFDTMLHLYEGGLRWSLAHPATVLGFSALILVLTVLLFARIPKGFLPSEDQNRLFAATEAGEGVSFEEMARHQQAVAAVVGRDPDVETFMSSAGARGQGAGNTGVLFLRLKPREERTASADEIAARLRPQLAQIPGIRTFIQTPPPIQLGGRLSRSLYQLTLQSADDAALQSAALALEERMRGVPGLVDVSSDLRLKSPRVDVLIDRDRASSLGLSARHVESLLYDAFGTRQISTIYAPANTYQVILELLPQFQSEPAALSQLYVRSPTGALVPLDAVAALRRSVGPLTINHSGQLPSVTLSFNLAPGASLGPAVAAVQRLANETVPGTVAKSFQGTAQAFQSSLAGLGWLLLFAILVIYVVLGILYESFIHPLTILSALPFAGFGALVALWLLGLELSVYAFVGVIMLVGLVKKNGIMMIDFALDAQRAGRPPAEAIYEACRVRFRPITMTTMAALMGTLPIALGYGAGAEARQPLGVAVVGGLLFSQLLTLYVTPVFYLAMERLVARSRRRRAAEPGPA